MRARFTVPGIGLPAPFLNPTAAAVATQRAAKQKLMPGEAEGRGWLDGLGSPTSYEDDDGSDGEVLMEGERGGQSMGGGRDGGRTAHMMLGELLPQTQGGGYRRGPFAARQPKPMWKWNRKPGLLDKESGEQEAQQLKMKVKKAAVKRRSSTGSSAAPKPSPLYSVSGLETFMIRQEIAREKHMHRDLEHFVEFGNSKGADLKAAQVLVCTAHDLDVDGWDSSAGSTSHVADVPSKEQILRSRLIRTTPGQFPRSDHRPPYKRFSRLCRALVEMDRAAQASAGGAGRASSQGGAGEGLGLRGEGTRVAAAGGNRVVKTEKPSSGPLLVMREEPRATHAAPTSPGASALGNRAAQQKAP